MRTAFVATLLISTFAAVPVTASMTPRRTTVHAPPSTYPVTAPPAPDFSESWGGTREARDRIRNARDAGLITKQQARRMRHEADAIDSTAARLRRNGLSADEATELDARTRYLGDAATRASPVP